MTKCLNCGRTLTTASGRRMLSATFDSSLPSRNVDLSDPGTVVWARCEPCYQVAVAQHKRIRKS